MKPLSTRTKEAIKTALAITAAYCTCLGARKLGFDISDFNLVIARVDTGYHPTLLVLPADDIVGQHNQGAGNAK